MSYIYRRGKENPSRVEFSGPAMCKAYYDIAGTKTLEHYGILENGVVISPDDLVMLLNVAYRSGQLDAQKEIRNALGIHDND